MKKQIVYLFLIFIIFSISNINAYQESLGIFEKGSIITLKQTCADCSYINISTIALPNSSTININQAMDNEGIYYYFDFEDSNSLGTYTVIGVGDPTGVDTTFAYTFEVTNNGKQQPDGIVIAIFILAFTLLFGFALISFIKSFGNVLELNMDIIDTATMMATYLSVWIFYYFAKEYLGNSFVNEILELAITVGAFTHILLPIIGFLVSFILTNLKFKQKQRVTY